MDWVHCNSCVLQPSEKEKKKFFLTSCGHICCEDCFQPDNECRTCHTKCNTIPLSSNMKPEVEIFFHDPIANFKKYMKVLEFQSSHRLRLISFYREMLRNYKVHKNETLHLKEELKLYKEENKKLREELKKLKLEFHEHKRGHGSRCSGDYAENRHEIHTFSPFCKESPKSNARSILEDSFTSSLKRPAESNYFFVTEKRSASQPVKKDALFTPPNLPKCPGDYRNPRMSMSELSSPSTPETICKNFKNKNPLQRRINLPTASPVSKLAFHGLNLSIHTSTPKNGCGLYDKFRKRCN